ncbi:TetR family transcriptional regulator [Arthrobacter sp. MYb213]|uniref:TetR family transcriptional regulator n=1 Tax=Arthrobacter sp. MYb213 TaxID=1848595 RepID=UPI0015E465DF|nr:TetR family transcriptional regulator [Arthrobacter sp. MYb213]
MPRSRVSDSQYKRQGVKLSSIVDAAIDLLDEGGMAAMTMRGVAARLGVSTSTVYWHAGNKEELQAAVCEALLGDLALPPFDSSATWDLWLRTAAAALRAEVRKHPNAVPLLDSLQIRPGSLEFMEGTLGALHAAGISSQNLVFAYNAVVGFLFGWVFSEFAPVPEDAPDGWEAELEKSVRSVSEVEFPLIHRYSSNLVNRSFLARWNNGAVEPLDESFEMALDILVAGLGRLAHSG